MTSFDVVAQVRRVFGTRRVGHAGTLDPMATGVLVILLGEATKLSNVLSTDKKSYVTTIRLGTTTDTLDREGKVTRRLPLPSSLSRTSIEAALEVERTRRSQIPPQVSAIKVAGKRAYEQARKGVEVPLAPRTVAVQKLELLSFSEDAIQLSMTVSKGYYVRSLGRDLAESLGTVGHLGALRRTKSGPFEESDLLRFPLEANLPLLRVEEAARRCLPIVKLTDRGALHARQGKVIEQHDVTDTLWQNDAGTSDQERRISGTVFAAFESDTMIALVEGTPDRTYRVRRGLSSTASSGGTIVTERNP